MPFKPGEPSANPSGRPKGSTNKLSPELREQIKTFVAEEGFPKLVEIFRKKGTSIWFQFHFVKELMPYIISKQAELQITDLTEENIKLILEKLKEDES